MAYGNILVRGGYMEIPFNYVVFYLMYILEKRKKELKINKNNLLLIFESLIKMYPYNKKDNETHIKQFESELDDFLYIYSDYIEKRGNDIFFVNACGVALEEVVSTLEEDNDDEVIEVINEIIDNNYIFLKLLGIEVNKKCYNFLLDNEKEIEKIYMNSLYGSDNLEIKRLKRLMDKKMFTMLFIVNNFNPDEYMGLYHYAVYMSELHNGKHDVLPHSDEDFGQDGFFNGPFFKALFYRGDICYQSIVECLRLDILELEGDDDDSRDNEKIFYTTLIQFLDEQINNIDDVQIVGMLNNGKNRLIYTIDFVFDICSYGALLEFDNNSNNYSSDDFSFVSRKIIIMIRSLLSCDDSKYFVDGEYNVDIYLLNILRVVYIKTYYHLTKDRSLVNHIRSNQFYGINKISSELIDAVISDKKIRIRKRQINN